MKRYIRFIFDRASVIIALSEEWRTWLLGISDNQNIQLIRNPVRLPLHVVHDDETQRVHNVIFLGKMVEKKGILDLLHAFNKLIKK